MDKQTFKAALERSWSRQTSTKWTPENPAAGQCAVTALVVQDRYGGEIAKTSIEGVWHFYNIIDGERIDFTVDQFSEPIEYHDKSSNRAEAFTDATEEQYASLSGNLRKQIPDDIEGSR